MCTDGELVIMMSGPAELRRTVLALVSASVISGVVWGLIVALHIQ